MINRENWTDAEEFLNYQAISMQRSPSTIKANWGRLKHLLLWADDKPLTKAGMIKPTLPAYMEGLAPGGKRLSAAYLASFFKTARYFLRWIKRENPGRFKGMSESWIDTLRSSRERSEVAELHVRQIYTMEEIWEIAKCGLASEDLVTRRVGAAAAFLFLSGMRIGAFLTLPICAVDLVHNVVRQLPELGVQTKNSKAAITYLLPIPELWSVVQAWDGFIRPKLAGTAYWYVHLDRSGLVNQARPSQANRTVAMPNFRKSLVKLCEEAGVEYKSPHKIRHGHVVWALKHCKTMEEFKSVSQNVMHSSVGITDAIYGDMVDNDVQKTIARLGEERPDIPDAAMTRLIEETIKRMMKEKD
jgi:integrase